MNERRRHRTGQASGPSWNRDSALDQLRQVSGADFSSAERKIRVGVAPDGSYCILYCRQEGVEIIAERSLNHVAVMVDNNEITNLIDRGSAGDTSVRQKFMAKFSPAQLSAIADVIQAFE